MNNLLVSHQVIDMLRYSQSVKKFIFASSYLVYDCALYSSSKKASDPVYLKETAQKNPRNLTGAAKYYAEKEIEFFHTNLSRDLQYINARIYRSYGEDSKDIISRWVRLALKGEELSLYGRDNSFDYIYARDVALGLIKLAQTDFIGSVNLGSGKSVPVAHVIDTLKRSFSKLKVKETKNSVHFENSGADMSLFKQLTKWMPAHDLQQGISRIITHEKSK